MEYYILLVVAVIIFFAYQSITANRRVKHLLNTKIKSCWGTIPTREYTYEELKKITHYYKSVKNKHSTINYIDDITWNDLDMDSVFMQLNATMSSVGEDYLYSLLRTPLQSQEELEERNRLIEYFYQNKEMAFLLQEIYANIGRTKSISLHDYIYGLKDLGKRSNSKHYFMSILLIASLVSLFFIPQYSIIFIIIMVGINVVQYMKAKAQIESYFISFRYLVNMIVNSEKIIQLNIKDLSKYNQSLKDTCDSLSSLKRGVFLLTNNNMSGSIADAIMDYVRMLFHVDIIKFNSMLVKVINKLEEIDTMFETLGKIESMISIASYRKAFSYYCNPLLKHSSNKFIDFNEIYHPLISHPVVNNLSENTGVLLTGSNASGKSTFLKTVAINAILAQTIYTCLAKSYKSNFFSIYTSMSLKDDLDNNESYYIVEIKSLKRILDRVNTDAHVLCFIDEVLRGTNTVERIAASSQILKSLARKNVLCFAATHDIELTHLLEKDYANYHFQEKVLDNDVKFNYHLYQGRATTRNAIKLLSIIGYDKEIIEKAESSAKRFVHEGIWTLENV